MKDVVGKRSDSWLKGPPTILPDTLGEQPLSADPGCMEMESAAASTRFHQPHMEEDECDDL